MAVAELFEWLDPQDKTEEECETFLKSYYPFVLNEVAKARSGRRADSAVDSDFLLEWNRTERQKYHLPATCRLLQLRFRKHDHRRELRYGRSDQLGPRTLLLMAGYSHEQLAFSIAFHHLMGDVDEVVPFFGGSDWTRIACLLSAVLRQMLGRAAAEQAWAKVRPVVSVASGSPAKVFRAIMDWYWLGDNRQRRCAVDVTGGQKPMDAGGTYAAMFMGIAAYYLDFEEYDSDRRRPFPHSLKYEELALPQVVFSHDARKAVLELFQARRFRTAQNRLVELQDGLRRQLASPNEPSYFTIQEQEDVERAVKLVETSSAWMNGDYCHETLAGHPLHATFCSVAPKDPKAVLTSMQQALASPADGISPSILQYLLDEYWRLRTMLYPGHEAAFGRDVSRRDHPSELVRDVLVGTCALAEVAFDSLFFLPMLPATVVDCTAVRFEAGDSPRLQECAGLTDEKSKLLQSALINATLPAHRFPPGSTGKKADLLRKEKKAKFTVYVPATAASASPTGDIEQLRSSVCDALVSADKVEPNKKHWEVDMTVGTRKLLDVATSTWKKHWGGFGNNEADWMRNRNAIAHMRAPVTVAQLDLAHRAIDVFVPRFLGLLGLASSENPQFPITDDNARLAGEALVASPRGPWHEAGCDDHQLRNWLRLPPVG